MSWVNVLDLQNRVRVAVETKKYLKTPHAELRMKERDLIDPELENILLNGRHTPSKDQWNEQWQSWRYAICGQVDDRHIRVAVSFEREMLIITVIDEDLKDEF